jgi:hypothetical protein
VSAIDERNAPASPLGAPRELEVLDTGAAKRRVSAQSCVGECPYQQVLPIGLCHIRLPRIVDLSDRAVHGQRQAEDSRQQHLLGQ